MDRIYPEFASQATPPKKNPLLSQEAGWGEECLLEIQENATPEFQALLFPIQTNDSEQASGAQSLSVPSEGASPMEGGSFWDKLKRVAEDKSDALAKKWVNGVANVVIGSEKLQALNDFQVIRAVQSIDPGY